MGSDGDAASAEFDQRYLSLPKEKLDALDNIGEADEAARVASAARAVEFGPDATAADIADQMARGLRDLEPQALQAVLAGRAELHQQAAAIRFIGAYKEMRARG